MLADLTCLHYKAYRLLVAVATCSGLMSSLKCGQLKEKLLRVATATLTSPVSMPSPVVS